MKTQTQLFTWLKANLGKHCLAPLTSHDVEALMAAQAIVPMISWEGAPAELFQAYKAVVEEMQPHCRYLAFHAIAAELDWGHRAMIWGAAGLSFEDVRGVCVHGPQLRELQPA